MTHDLLVYRGNYIGGFLPEKGFPKNSEIERSFIGCAATHFGPLQERSLL